MPKPLRFAVLFLSQDIVVISSKVEFSLRASKYVVLGLIGRIKYFRETFIKYPSDIQKSLILIVCFSLKCADIVVISGKVEFRLWFSKHAQFEFVGKKKLFRGSFALGPNHFDG